MKEFIKELQDLEKAIKDNKSKYAIGVHKVRIHCYYKKLMNEIEIYTPKDNKCK